MRFVKLKRKKGKSPYDSILKFGCGPNFVLNRSELFQQMVKEQGVTFWFRFWLTFCLHPGCSDLKAIQQEWPEIACCVNAGVHKLLLQDSVEGACQYCFGIIRSMRLPSNSYSIFKEKHNKVTSKQLLQKLFIKCTGMALGCALCEVFYKWLNSTDNQDKHEKYWSIPKKYLDTEFKPGLLEDFLVNEWQDQLLLLLGVTEKQMDWLSNLLYAYEDEISEISKEDKTKRQCNFECDDYEIDIQEVIDYMTLRRNHKLKKIKEIDEISKTKSADNIACLSDHHVCELPKKVDAETQFTIDNVKTQPQQCSYCHTRRIGSKKFKKCKRCLEENWPEPRYYCSTVCRIDHWFEQHHKEHSQYIKRMIQELWPEVLCFVKMGIHRRFVQDTHENICKYCLDEVIRPMLLKSQEKKPFFKKKRAEVCSADQLHELVSKCSTLAFGTALCEVFFKWLVANYVDDNCQRYWTVPAEYLDSKFKPRLLEEFLVIQWKDTLPKLLGVTDDHVPWIAKLINGNKDQIFGEDEDQNAYKYDSAKFLQEVVEFMHKNRNRRNVTCDNGDGIPFSQTPEFELQDANSNFLQRKQYRQCSYCKAFEETKKFKKCKRCVDENWKEPRYYCDAVCQIDDWYQVHHEEHTRYKEHKLVKTKNKRAKTV